MSLSSSNHDENPQIQKSPVSEEVANTKLHQVSPKCRREETRYRDGAERQCCWGSFSFSAERDPQPHAYTPLNLTTGNRWPITTTGDTLQAVSGSWICFYTHPCCSWRDWLWLPASGICHITLSVLLGSSLLPC